MAEDHAAADSSKRKRGRPAKPEGTATAAKRKSTGEGGTSGGKKGRGRPKGSKAKSPKKAAASKGGKGGKRGRPAKGAAKATKEAAADSGEASD